MEEYKRSRTKYEEFMEYQLREKFGPKRKSVLLKQLKERDKYQSQLYNKVAMEK